VGQGHCVLDGSFSDLQLKIADGNPGSVYQEHCMSRAFPIDDLDGHLAGSKISIPIIRELIDQTDYSSFLSKLRAGPMTAIPEWIGGDFSGVTGPNDPLFILHLAYVNKSTICSINCSA
jgi:tyrosinase